MTPINQCRHCGQPNTTPDHGIHLAGHHCPAKQEGGEGGLAGRSVLPLAVLDSPHMRVREARGGVCDHCVTTHPLTCGDGACGGYVIRQMVGGL